MAGKFEFEPSVQNTLWHIAVLSAVSDVDRFDDLFAVFPVHFVVLSVVFVAFFKMADAGDMGDMAAGEFSSKAAYYNARRFHIPPVVNDYSAIRLHRQLTFVDGTQNSTPILGIPSTSNMNSIYWVNLSAPGAPGIVNESRVFWANPNTGMTAANLRTGSTVASQLHNIYDYYRVRAVKFLFEPLFIQPLTNAQPMDVYCWWVDNHYTVDIANLNNEYEDFMTFRDDIPGSRITKLAHQNGHSFAVRCVPQIGEAVQFALGTQNHVIPAPWMQRENDVVMWTPILAFRRPFNSSPTTFGFSVSVECILEFKDANPNDEN